jgi:N-acetylmuramoyl-L-alanine amidase
MKMQFHRKHFSQRFYVISLRAWRGALPMAALVVALCAAGFAFGRWQTASCQEVSYISSSELYALQTRPPYTIALDPGHGGMDRGAEALVDEVIVCERTVDDLYALLDSDPNYCPVRTRENGIDLSTKDRAQVATDHHASLLLSIHANSDSSTRQSHGFECFPTPPGRVYYPQAMRFAHCLADGMEGAGHRLHGQNGIRFAYYNGHSKKIVPSTDTRVRSMKSFGMVEKPACPAVLVEQCFLTNYKDVKQWASEEGCARAARVYYEAICTYFGTTPTLPV